MLQVCPPLSDCVFFSPFVRFVLDLIPPGFPVIFSSRSSLCTENTRFETAILPLAGQVIRKPKLQQRRKNTTLTDWHKASRQEPGWTSCFEKFSCLSLSLPLPLRPFGCNLAGSSSETNAFPVSDGIGGNFRSWRFRKSDSDFDSFRFGKCRSTEFRKMTW